MVLTRKGSEYAQILTDNPIFFLLQLSLFSQSNYVEGFVLKSQTDTLYGTIQNNAYYDNSEFCNYKDAQGNEFKFFFFL